MQPSQTQPVTGTEEGPNKAVHIMFLSGGLLLFFLLNWTGEWIGSYFVRNPNDFLVNGLAALVALVVGIALYRNDNVYTLAHEVASELKKVTWPTKKETQLGTIVVIVMVLISAVILYSMDIVWAYITDSIYG
jgi:preprotein translocase subunit SecE